MMMGLVDLEAEYARSVGDLVRFATALVGPDDAVDVVSEAVTSTLANRRLSMVDDPRAYWFRAVANRAASWHRAAYRRRHREGRAFASKVSDETISPDQARELLGRLSAQQRAVVYLTYWHDWDPPTIASALRVSDGTVRKQLARGRERLREVMRDEQLGS